MAYVTFAAEAVDPDGDPVTYEWADRTADDYYALGQHTVRVRARDSFGDVSDWAEVDFEIANEAPGRPTISRLPADGFVMPGTPVTITANAVDPDGDAVTYSGTTARRRRTSIPTAGRSCASRRWTRSVRRACATG